MNIAPSPPSSAGLIDRLAEMAEGLWRGLDEDADAGLGDVLFVMIAVHCLMRFASLYLRLKAGWLAPLRTQAAAAQDGHAGARTTPRATARAAAPIQRENDGGGQAAVPSAGVAQAPATAGAVIAVVPMALLPPRAPANRVPPAVPSHRTEAPGLHRVIQARPRRPDFSRARDGGAFARAFRFDIKTN